MNRMLLTAAFAALTMATQTAAVADDTDLQHQGDRPRIEGGLAERSHAAELPDR